MNIIGRRRRGKTLSALKGISPVEGETMRGGNGKRSGNGKRRSLDEDKDGDKDNIKTSGPTSRMALPLYGGDAQGAERVCYYKQRWIDSLRLHVLIDMGC